MKKLVLTGVMLLAALLFAGAQQGYAYDNVTSTPDGGCLACHAFAGGTGAGTQRIAVYRSLAAHAIRAQYPVKMLLHLHVSYATPLVMWAHATWL